MAADDGWILTVTEDAAALLAELRRHGMRPGQRVRVLPAHDEPPAKASEDTAGRLPRHRLGFIGWVHGGPADLSARADDYLQEGFGHG